MGAVVPGIIRATTRATTPIVVRAVTAMPGTPGAGAVGWPRRFATQTPYPTPRTSGGSTINPWATRPATNANIPYMEPRWIASTVAPCAPSRASSKMPM